MFEHDITHYRNEHVLNLPESHKASADVDTLEQVREFAVNIKECTRVLDTQNENMPEHEMFVSPIPDNYDEQFGQVIQYAIQKDRNDHNGKTRSLDNVIPFSSTNLLRQVCVARKKYGNKLMACIDSTHGNDLEGGKLMSFGYILFDKPGNIGSKYRHTYIPLVFCRVLEECEEAALYMLCSLGKAVSLLFGLELEFKGGSYEPSQRTAFFDAADSLCYVCQDEYVDGRVDWMCDCVRFYKTTACQHAYLIKYHPTLLEKKKKGRNLKSS